MFSMVKIALSVLFFLACFFFFPFSKEGKGGIKSYQDAEDECINFCSEILLSSESYNDSFLLVDSEKFEEIIKKYKSSGFSFVSSEVEMRGGYTVLKMHSLIFRIHNYEFSFPDTPGKEMFRSKHKTMLGMERGE